MRNWVVSAACRSPSTSVSNRLGPTNQGGDGDVVCAGLEGAVGLMPMLKDFFRTTNCIENVNSLLQQLTHNARRWTNSSQRHRWVATVLLDIEPRLRRVRGHHHLPILRQAIQAEFGIKQLAMTG